MSNTPIRFIMVGGFLGAGKTTTMARLARNYQKQGLCVALVTNDQASDLVDTQLLRQQGFNVGEVAGSCFCCNFNELTATVDRLEEKRRPDIVIAEPVGSCTDLVATVIQPIMRLFDERFTVAPYGVILKPSHGLRILSGQSHGGFSPNAAYIFLKQLEEADFIIINRIDELAKPDVDRLEGLLKDRFPNVPIIRTSAKSGDGFDELMNLLDRSGTFGHRILDIDYDIYADGEAELGWLNSNIALNSSEPIAIDDFLMQLITQMQRAIASNEAEIAHLKLIAVADGAHAVTNVISSQSDAQLSVSSKHSAKDFDLVINARVAIDPERLREIVTEELREHCTQLNITYEVTSEKSLQPGRPVPTHRVQN
jgi:G3E family GTPase